MVRGIFFHLNFPYSHFATRGATGDLLFPLVWEAVCRLETNGIKVLSITFDGASSNRKFFPMHHDRNDQNTFIYKALNPYSDDHRWIVFSDRQHLLKTIACTLQETMNNGQTIEWQQIERLYDKILSTSADSHELSLIPKLKRDHIQLNSYSKMRVDLAAKEWKNDVDALLGITSVDRNKMQLSKETLEGIHITSNERISQGSLENYFGKQRARGGRNEHPDLNQCLINASAILLQKSLALNPVRGNSRRKRLASKKVEVIDYLALN
uniref:Transposable element P transposase n=1 Tax=Amphimedon queenslandica TaxID=400682 RepID=A0A1X7V1Z3_AMPQE